MKIKKSTITLALIAFIMLLATGCTNVSEAEEVGSSVQTELSQTEKNNKEELNEDLKPEDNPKKNSTDGLNEDLKPEDNPKK